MKNENIESLLIETLSDQTIEFTAEVAQLSVENFLNENFLEDIPIFSLPYKGVKIFKGIREALFGIKIYRFLKEFSLIKDSEKNHLIFKIKQSNTEKIKVGQALLMILDKLDDLDKTEILANLFLAYIKSQITHAEFIHLCSIVQNCYLNYLRDFCRSDDTRKLNVEVQNTLSNYGLMLPIIMDYKSLYGDSYIIDEDNNKNTIVYAQSQIGVKMRKFAFEK